MANSTIANLNPLVGEVQSTTEIIIQENGETVSKKADISQLPSSGVTLPSLEAGGNISVGTVVASAINGTIEEVVLEGTNLALIDSELTPYTVVTNMAITMMTDTTFIAVYHDSVNKGMIVHGTITAGAIVLDTPVQYDSGTPSNPFILKWDDTHVIVMYNGTTSQLFSRIIRYTGGTYTVGNPALLSLNTQHGSLAKLDDTNAVLHYAGVGQQAALVCTPDTTDLVLYIASGVLFDTSTTVPFNVIRVNDNEFLLAADSGACTLRRGTRSGTVTSTGDGHNVTASGNFPWVVDLSGGVYGYFYNDNVAGEGHARLFEIQGTTIVEVSSGAIVFSLTSITYTRVEPLSNGDYALSYISDGALVTRTFSRSDYTLTFTDEIDIEATAGTYSAMYPVGDNDYVVMGTPTTQLKYYLMNREPIISNADDWIGIASETVTTGNQCSYYSRGKVSPDQTGLVPATGYFLTDNGVINTTDNGRSIGKALTTTDLLIGG